MLIKTVIKQLGAAGRFNAMFWQNRHIYMLTRDSTTGQWKRVYLDLKFTYADGRPYFVEAKYQAAIRGKDKLPRQWDASKAGPNWLPFKFRHAEAIQKRKKKKT